MCHVDIRVRLEFLSSYCLKVLCIICCIGEWSVWLGLETCSFYRCKFRLPYCMHSGIGNHAAYFPVDTDTVGACFSSTVQRRLCLTRQNVRVCEVEYSPPSVVEVKSAWNLMHTLVARWSGKKDNCTFFFRLQYYTTFCCRTDRARPLFYNSNLNRSVYNTQIPKLLMYLSYKCVTYKPSLCPVVVVLTMK